MLQPTARAVSVNTKVAISEINGLKCCGKEAAHSRGVWVVDDRVWGHVREWANV